MNAYLLCLDIGSVEVNRSYEKLPPHCTLAPWFLSSVAVKQVVDELATTITSFAHVNLTIGEEAIFGPPDIAVSRVVLTPELQRLHTRVLTCLQSMRAVFLKPEFVGEGYNPHISHHEGFTGAIGEVYTCSSAYLVNIDEHNGNRIVAARFAFGPT